MVNAEAIVVENLAVRLDDAQVLRDVSLTVGAGQVVALLGPSGCGKTTLLRAIAGLETPSHGSIRVGPRLLVGPGVNLAPERRGLGMVFQDWALFPHMSVAANVGYGLSRDQRRSDRVDEVLALVGLAGLGSRSPGSLSGGQQQRVALARALAPEPAVLLLDEPFSNLDTALRVEVRVEVHRLLCDLGVTTIFVTHDQEEAFVLGDEVAVMRAGRIEQQASPGAIYDRPANPWVARFVGDANLMSARAEAGVATTMIGSVPLAGTLDSGDIEVLVRPECVEVSPGDDGVIELVEFYGHDTVYEISLDTGGRLRSRVAAAPRLSRGDRVRLSYTGAPTTAWPRLGSSGAPGPAPVPSPAAAAS